MDLDTYLSSHETAASLAKRIGGVNPALISQWRSGRRPVPETMCWPIERATNGLVTRSELRPKDYHLIWPELAA